MIEDDTFFDSSGRLDGYIDYLLEIKFFLTSVETICGDDHPSTGISDTIGYRLRAKPCEYHRVYSTDTGTGEHSHRCLRDHG